MSFIANVETFYKIRFRKAPTSVSHLFSVPEEDPKDHVFECVAGNDVEYFIVTQGPQSLIVRLADESEKEFIKKGTLPSPGVEG